MTAVLYEIYLLVCLYVSTSIELHIDLFAIYHMHQCFAMLQGLYIFFIIFTFCSKAAKDWYAE